MVDSFWLPDADGLGEGLGDGLGEALALGLACGRRRGRARQALRAHRQALGARALAQGR